MDWIENHGEAFLSKHTGVGKSLHRARALQKRHDDFEDVAQVSYWIWSYSEGSSSLLFCYVVLQFSWKEQVQFVQVLLAVEIKKGQLCLEEAKKSAQFLITFICSLCKHLLVICPD